MFSPAPMSLAGTPVVAGVSPSGPLAMTVSPQVFPALSPVREPVAAQSMHAAGSSAKLLSPIAAFIAQQKKQVSSPSPSPLHKKQKRSPLTKIALPQSAALPREGALNGMRLFSATTPAPKVQEGANAFLLVTPLQPKR